MHYLAERPTESGARVLGIAAVVSRRKEPLDLRPYLVLVEKHFEAHRLDRLPNLPKVPRNDPRAHQTGHALEEHVHCQPIRHSACDRPTACTHHRIQSTLREVAVRGRCRPPAEQPPPQPPPQQQATWVLHAHWPAKPKRPNARP